MTATAAQISYINSLREDKGWRMELTEAADPSMFRTAEDAERFAASQEAGRAAYERGTEGLTKDEASEIIAALKAW